VKERTLRRISEAFK